MFGPLPERANVNTPGLSSSNNGLLSLTSIDLLSPAEGASMLLTANQSGISRCTTIDTASMIFPLKGEVSIFSRRPLSDNIEDIIRDFPACISLT